MKILNDQNDAVLQLRRRRTANRISGFVKAAIGWTFYSALIVWILMIAVSYLSQP